MFAITHPIGGSGKNESADVRKVETLLGRFGHLDLSKTDGPTGYFGGRLEDAIKSYQKDENLKVDGRLNPNGETITQLGKEAQSGGPKPPVPPTPPSVSKPTKPKTPVVPNAPGKKREGEDAARARGLSDKDIRKQYIREFWRRLEMESLGR